MPLADVAPLSASIEIDAEPAQVWALVSDLRNMARWSPQTGKSFRRGGPGLGARFLTINRMGVLVWPTQSTVVRFEVPGADGTGEIAWRVKENYCVWSLRLEPTATGGTTLTSARETPEGISEHSAKMIRIFFGGDAKYTATLVRDMGSTLTRIKSAAER